MHHQRLDIIVALDLTPIRRPCRKLKIVQDFERDFLLELEIDLVLDLLHGGLELHIAPVKLQGLGLDG